MVMGGCCSSACRTVLGAVDVMGYGLLAQGDWEEGGGAGENWEELEEGRRRSTGRGLR
ncbi:hypothetical protein GCM10010344_27130 [Streptomyces bluensis]|nr:hypothetical protein GCM10010344_27130 [Streptomyces bluensis]